MPKHTFPQPKKKKKKSGTSHVPTVAAEFDDNEFMRRVHDISANKEIVESLTVGDKYTVLLEGTITGIDSHAHADRPDRHSFDFTMDSVEVYPTDDNEFSKLADDD